MYIWVPGLQPRPQGGNRRAQLATGGVRVPQEEQEESRSRTSRYGRKSGEAGRAQSLIGTERARAVYAGRLYDVPWVVETTIFSQHTSCCFIILIHVLVGVTTSPVIGGFKNVHTGEFPPRDSARPQADNSPNQSNMTVL